MTTTACTSLWVLSAASALLILLYFSPCNQNISISTLSISSATHHRSLMKKHSDLESVEDGLGKARKAIKDAIQLRKSSSYHKNKNDTYIPRGEVYRNPYAFHQSHTEMERRFKVWVYREGEVPLFHFGPAKGIYGIEGQFIDELREAGKSRFLARHPDVAHAFFLPISVVHIIQFLYRPLVTYSRHQMKNVVADYVSVLADKYPYWNRSNGADHFYLSCHDWAPDVSESDPKFYKNLIRALCNANRSEGFEPQRDVSIPEINVPPSELSPSSASAQPPSNRSILVFFAGGAHGHIRHVILQHWKDKDEEIKVHEYLENIGDYLVFMSQSKFCLCPSGYEVASPRVVTAIQLGCIPVTISDNYTLPFSDVLDWIKFSINIPPAKIAEIKTILKGVSDTEYERMYRQLLTVQRHFTLNRPALPYDMIHMVLHSVWLRRLNVMMQ